MLLYLYVCANLQFEGKIDLKLGVASASATQPTATDYRLYNSTGFAEKVSCFTSFTTTIDPSLFTIPPSCKKVEYYDEEDLVDLVSFF